jgi:hypothetical protein
MTTLSGKEFNEKYPNKVFYTVLRTNSQHNKVPLVNGLNIITDDIINYGGLRFDELSKLYVPDKGNIVNVIIPSYATVYIKSGEISESQYFDADQIILDLNNKLSIRDFYNWTNYDLCKKLVSQNGRLLRYVKEQTEDLCKIAVKQAGSDTLKIVKPQTDQICEVAVQQNGNALRFVKHQTNRICELAIRQDSHALIYVNNQTDELCRLAELSKKAHMEWQCSDGNEDWLGYLTQVN